MEPTEQTINEQLARICGWRVKCAPCIGGFNCYWVHCDDTMHNEPPKYTQSLDALRKVWEAADRVPDWEPYSDCPTIADFIYTMIDNKCDRWVFDRDTEELALWFCKCIGKRIGTSVERAARGLG